MGRASRPIADCAPQGSICIVYLPQGQKARAVNTNEVYNMISQCVRVCALCDRVRVIGLHSCFHVFILTTSFVQSRLLIAVGGFADGLRERNLMSKISKRLLRDAVRRLPLLRERLARQHGSQYNKSKATFSPAQRTIKEVKRLWREWLGEEKRLRLGWATYVRNTLPL